MEHKNYKYQTNYQKASLGVNGQRVITTSSIEDETFIAFTSTEDTVVSYELNENEHGERGDSVVTNLSLPPGIVVVGLIKNIVVTSGKVIALKG